MPERPKSFAEQLVNTGRLLYLVRGQSNGRAAWYYLLLDRRKVELFRGRLKHDNDSIQLLDYGKVIESGWGENPPDSIKKRLEDAYP